MSVSLHSFSVRRRCDGFNCSENDHRPEFEKEEVQLRVGEDVVDGYQVIVGGAKDLDEGENGEVRYLLDCSSGREREGKKLMKKVQTMSNCLGMFELMFLSEMRSETMIGFDQLAIKITSQLSKRRVKEEDEFQLIVLAMDQNAQGKQLSSEMKIRIEIEEKEKFIVVKKYFLIDRLDRHERRDLGDLIEQRKKKTLDEEITYQLLNQTTDLHIDRVTGRVKIEHEEKWRFDSNEKRRTYLIQVISTTAATTNKPWKKKRSLVQLQLFPRRLDQLNEIWLRPSSSSSSSSSSSWVKNLSSIVINLNEIQFVSSIDFVIENDFYPDDEFVIENLNDKDLFRVEEKHRRETTKTTTTKKRKVFSLQFLRFSALKTNEIYRLNLRIEHPATQQLLNNRIIDIQLRSSPFTPSSSSFTTSNEMIIHLHLHFLFTIIVGKRV